MGAQGTAILDFGAFPGAVEASLAITGQAGIVAGSLVEAWIMPTAATAGKTTDEIKTDRVRVTADTLVAGTGFTIRGFNNDAPAWKDVNYNYVLLDGGAQKQRTYGKFNVGWCWN